MGNHILYTPDDFKDTNPEDILARYVCEGGLGICKICGAGEVELDEYTTCEEYKEHLRKCDEAQAAAEENTIV